MFNEKEVISRIISGDLKAFSLLVKQYENLVFHVTNRLVKDQQDKEDICQEVFIKIHKNLDKFEFNSKLSTWIARIAYLTTINHLRKHRKMQLEEYPELLENEFFTEEDPQKILVKRDEAAYVNQLIEKLPEKYRLLLTLYHLNEFSYQEIEEITGMAEGTVKNYLFRARKLLKERLESYLKKEDL